MPVLSLTAKSQPADVVQGFRVGGNDYLRKPFSLEELAVRLRELLRRSSPTPALPVVVELWLEGQLSVRLSHRESELLVLLVRQQPLPWTAKLPCCNCGAMIHFFTPARWICLFPGCASICAMTRT